MKKLVLIFISLIIYNQAQAEQVQCVSIALHETKVFKLEKGNDFNNCLNVTDALDSDKPILFFGFSPNKVVNELSLYNSDAQIIEEGKSDLDGVNILQLAAQKNGLLFTVKPLSHLYSDKSLTVTLVHQKDAYHAIFEINDINSGSSNSTPLQPPIGEEGGCKILAGERVCNHAF